MTDDRAVRDALHAHLGSGPPMTTTPELVLQAGRRSRTMRQVATTALSGMTVAAVAIGTYAVVGTGDPRPLDPPMGGLPSVVATPTTPVQAPGSKPVYGGPVPALIKARVRAALPGAPLTLDTVYPSDWNRSTPLPPAQAANATDWHGAYTVKKAVSHEFWVGVFIEPPGTKPTAADLRQNCKALGGPAYCSYSVLPDGSLLFRQITSAKGRWTRTALHFRNGDRTVNVREKVDATSLADANKKWSVPLSKLYQLATDPLLNIPQPQIRPPLPR
jgi:hypothetical protein